MSNLKNIFVFLHTIGIQFTLMSCLKSLRTKNIMSCIYFIIFQSTEPRTFQTFRKLNLEQKSEVIMQTFNFMNWTKEQTCEFWTSRKLIMVCPPQKWKSNLEPTLIVIYVDDDAQWWRFYDIPWSWFCKSLSLNGNSVWNITQPFILESIF